MRVGIIGGGTIAKLFIENIRRGGLGRARVVAIAGRSEHSRGKRLAASFRIPFVIGPGALLAKKPDVVVEAASHESVREYGVPLLRKGVRSEERRVGKECRRRGGSEDERDNGEE